MGFGQSDKKVENAKMKGSGAAITSLWGLVVVLWWGCKVLEGRYY